MERAVEKYDLKGWHYYFSKDKEPLLWEEITQNLPKDHMSGYPHYIIAKNGEIISFDAPKPESPEDLIKLLSQM